jgi:hypothetical protein
VRVAAEPGAAADPRAGELVVRRRGASAVDEELSDSERIRRFEVTTGVEVFVHGDDSRSRLACRVIEQREMLSAQAVRTLDAFMRHRGEYDLSTIDVLAAKAADGCDFSLRFTFVADRDPHEYNYTYFEVYYGCQEPPAPAFWPHKLTIGFW